MSLKAKVVRAEALTVVSAVFFLLFLFVFPLRVANWGGMASHASLFASSPSPEIWGQCAENAAAAARERSFPLSPTMIAVQNRVLIRQPGEMPSCNAHDVATARFDDTRFRLDAYLTLTLGLVFPALLFLSRERQLHPAILALAAISPFLFDAMSSSVWTNAYYQWAGQHVAIARNLVVHGVYGWTASDLSAYGFPAPAIAAWGMGATPSPSGWTYPGYTLLLAAAFAPFLWLSVPSETSLVIVSIAVNVLLVLATLGALHRAMFRIVGDARLALVPIYMFCLSGWAWSLCPYPASEPLQAFLFAVSLLVALSHFPASIKILLLATFAGMGHITKPVLGAIPSLALMAYVQITGSRVRPSTVIVALVMLALPTALLTLRNFAVFGVPVAGSTVGNVFLAQGLDVSMTLPTYFGANELSYGAGATADVRQRLAAFFADETYREALLLQRGALVTGMLTGTSFVAEIGRMGNDGFSGTTLLLLCLAIPYGIARAVRNPLGIESALIFIMIGSTAALVLSQPLGRYIVPPALALPVLLAVFMAEGFRTRAGFALYAASAAALLGLSASALRHYGWY